MAAAATDGSAAAADVAEIEKLSEAERVKDISKSPAFAFLDDCVRKQILTPGQYVFALSAALALSSAGIDHCDHCDQQRTN